MTDNGNSVNIKNPKRGYHHGNLRQALVAEGLKLLASTSVEQISLREIARNVGVSATAVYRHFPDKDALLRAMAYEGDRQFAAFAEAAKSEAGGGKAGFDASGKAYVRFALDNPALFRLMMHKHRTIEYKSMDPPESPGFKLLTDSVADLTAPGTPEHTQRIIALQAWAIVHGLATLMLDGMIPDEEGLIDAVITAPMV